jgi:hypothetical protein
MNERGFPLARHAGRGVVGNPKTFGPLNHPHPNLLPEYREKGPEKMSDINALPHLQKAGRIARTG